MPGALFPPFSIRPATRPVSDNVASSDGSAYPPLAPILFT
jgi:hypothetical protein